MSMSVVQSNHTYPGNTCGLNGVTAHNVILVVCAWNNTGGSPSISDNLGGSYSLLQDSAASTRFTMQDVWWAEIPSSGNIVVTLGAGFGDQGMAIIECNVGGNTSGLLIASAKTAGMASPQTVTLQTYMDGLAVGFYASESTPVANPSGVNLSQLLFQSGHADWQGALQTTVTQALAFGYTGTVQNNQNYIGVTLGKFVQPTRVHSTDANKRKQTTVAHTTDSIRHTKNLKTHSTDANKRKTLTRSHSTDAFIGFSKKHTTDALKRTRTLKIHSTDALKKFVIKKTHTTDTAKHFTVKKTFTTDASLHVAVRRSHTTDARKHVNTGKPPQFRSGYKPQGVPRNSGNDKPRLRR